MNRIARLAPLTRQRDRGTGRPCALLCASGKPATTTVATFGLCADCAGRLADIVAASLRHRPVVCGAAPNVQLD